MLKKKKKKKTENTLKSLSIFILSLWPIPHKIVVKKPTKKPVHYEFLNKIKKIANLTKNNQLEFFFSKTKYIYYFTKPKSQTPKDSKRITTFIKPTRSTSTSKL